jgi:hypothetical protein
MSGSYMAQENSWLWFGFLGMRKIPNRLSAALLMVKI